MELQQTFETGSCANTGCQSKNSQKNILILKFRMTPSVVIFEILIWTLSFQWRFSENAMQYGQDLRSWR